MKTIVSLAALSALSACALIAGIPDETDNPSLCFDPALNKVVQCDAGAPAGGASASSSGPSSSVTSSAISGGGSGGGCPGAETLCEGKCVDPTKDDANCNGCGKACTGANSTQQCKAGACAVTACNAGFADCDGVANNGCEAELAKDVANCGACKHACGICGSGACQPQTLAMNQFQPYAIAVQGDTVFWGTAFDGVNSFIRSAPITGGNAATLAMLSTDVVGLAADGPHVYYTRMGGAVGFAYADGSGSSELLPTSSDPRDIVAGNGSIYWTTFGATGGVYSAVEGNVMGTAKLINGGAQPSANGLAVSMGNGLVWAATTAPNGTVSREQVPGDLSPTIIASMQSEPTRVATDGAQVYFADVDGNLHKVAIGGGPITTISSADTIWDIAVDATNVYWFQGDSIQRQPTAGGATVVLVSGVNSSGRLALDSTHVYWSSIASGTIMKIEKQPLP